MEVSSIKEIDVSDKLKQIYSIFFKERKQYQKKRWNTFGGYFKRVVNNKNEYLELLGSESEFHSNIYKWFSNYIYDNKLDVLDVKNILISLKQFKEELNGRNYFLILFVAILSLGVVFNSLLVEYLGSLKDMSVYAVNVVFALFAIVERGNNARYISNCQQLELLIEKWLNEQSELTKKSSGQCKASLVLLTQKRASLHYR